MSDLFYFVIEGAEVWNQTMTSLHFISQFLLLLQEFEI